MKRRKPNSDEKACDGAVIPEGLRSPQGRERTLENWLHEEVVATYDAMRPIHHKP
jgi:hypothetical protein